MKDKNGRTVGPQATPRPRWTTCVDEAGNALRVGAYILKEYKGFFKKSSSSQGRHKYLAECISCGTLYIMPQDSLVKSEELKSEQCKACKRKGDEGVKWAKQQKKFNAWVEVLRQWPATAVEMRKGFDSERQATTCPAIFGCDPKQR